MCGSDGLSLSSSLLICGKSCRCQAENPLNALPSFTRPALNYLMEYNRKYFLNGAQVGLYIQTDTNVEGNIDRIRKGWANRQEGNENAHKVPVLPKGVKLEHTGVTHKDMDFKDLTEATRDRILAA